VADNRKKFRLKEGKLIPLDQNEYDLMATEEDKNRLFEGISLASDLGFAIAIPIAGGAILGSILDQKLNTQPKITLSLIFFGIFISFYNIYKIVRKNSG
jgi:F0F1-type ATP synthase assembly protein I